MAPFSFIMFPPLNWKKYTFDIMTQTNTKVHHKNYILPRAFLLCLLNPVTNINHLEGVFLCFSQPEDAPRSLSVHTSSEHDPWLVTIVSCVSAHANTEWKCVIVFDPLFSKVEFSVILLTLKGACTHPQGQSTTDSSSGWGFPRLLGLSLAFKSELTYYPP